MVSLKFVAGTVLQTLLSLHSVSQSLILFLKSSKHLHSQTVRARDQQY